MNLPCSAPDPAPVVLRERTWTCDVDGNWREETRPLWKDAGGWHDLTVPAEPTPSLEIDE